MRKFWVYCIDTATGLRFSFPFLGANAEDCRNRVMDCEVLKAGEIIERVGS